LLPPRCGIETVATPPCTHTVTLRSLWQARFVYKLRNDTRLEDYVCGEAHRDLASVAGVRCP
jgi:hypothetical protein